MQSPDSMVAESASERFRPVPFAAVLAAPFCAGAFLFTARLGLNTADEGYLWYGVQRTVAGAVPMRDFQSYEPGRYWWCAAFAGVFGDGILVVRAAAVAFHALGLFLALLVAS